MRYFVVQDINKDSIAVVFHNHDTGYVLCRSKRESFRKSFDAVAGKTATKFIKTEDRLVLEIFDPSYYSWIDEVLNKLCSFGYWSVVSSGQISGSEEEIDAKIEEFLV